MTDDERKAYQKAYEQRPERKAYLKAYRQRQAQKAKRKARYADERRLIALARDHAAEWTAKGEQDDAEYRTR